MNDTCTPPGSVTLTADMLAQYAYCPRRMHLIYVDGRWGDNVYTDQGRSVHARTDDETDALPAPCSASPEDDPEPVVARSVMLGDETLGVVAKPDIVEAQGNVATPVEIKRGHVPLTLNDRTSPNAFSSWCRPFCSDRMGSCACRGWSTTPPPAVASRCHSTTPSKPAPATSSPKPARRRNGPTRNVTVSAQCLHLLCGSGIPVVHLSMGHWFYGVTAGIGLRNAYDRAAQFAAAADDGRRLALARAFVKAKAQNQRTFLRRNTTADIEAPLDEMRRLIARLDACADTDELMGVEGSIAAVYFANWSGLLTEGAVRDAFTPASRNRRPPRDPINAMLSFAYALLAKETTVALLAEGLDPYWGFLHRPRHGRPALALDLMEEFRPLVADSAVLSAVNTGMVAPSDFVTSPAGCAMKDGARKALIRAYELRLDQMVTHPVFDYRCSWRAIVRVQARLLAKALRGEVPVYIGITTR